MQLILYVIKRKTIDECISYLSWKTTTSRWRPLDMIKDIHFFTKKSIAEKHLVTPIYPDVITIEEICIEVD
jgi:hypothetical protein